MSRSFPLVGIANVVMAAVPAIAILAALYTHALTQL